MLESKAPAQRLLREIIVCYVLVFLTLVARPEYFYLVGIEFPFLAISLLLGSGFTVWCLYKLLRYALLG